MPAQTSFFNGRPSSVTEGLGLMPMRVMQDFFRDRAELARKDQDIAIQCVQKVVDERGRRFRSERSAMSREQLSFIEAAAWAVMNDDAMCLYGVMEALFNLQGRRSTHPTAVIKHTLQIALCGACNAGHAELVKILIEHGADLNDPSPEDDHGTSPLIQSISQRKIEVTKMLLEARASPHGPCNAEGWPPLHISICVHDLEAVQLLVDHRADVSQVARDYDLTSAIHLAATFMDRIELKEEKVGVDDAQKTEADKAESMQVFKHLVSLGADLNAQTVCTRACVRPSAPRIFFSPSRV